MPSAMRISIGIDDAITLCNILETYILNFEAKSHLMSNPTLHDWYRKLVATYNRVGGRLRLPPHASKLPDSTDHSAGPAPLREDLPAEVSHGAAEAQR